MKLKTELLFSVVDTNLISITFFSIARTITRYEVYYLFVLQEENINSRIF